VDRLTQGLSLLAIPVLLVVFVTCISLSRLYRTLEQMNARLETADQMKSDLMASVSHDLRTPLTGAQIAISSLLDPAAATDAEHIRITLTAANAELHRASRRVQNLLRISRLEAGQLVPHQEVCDLTDIALTAVEHLRPILDDRVVAVEFPDYPLLTEADQEQVGTVVQNLLENAHKYAPAGTPIHLTGERHGRLVRISVRDHGPGIPSGEERRVFERYYRAGDASASGGGTGLGLAIARGIILAHGGSIGVTTPLDGGAEFWFALPAAESPTGQKAAPA
jgi:K+-sensing histidine kinase KdpD